MNAMHRTQVDQKIIGSVEWVPLEAITITLQPHPTPWCLFMRTIPTVILLSCLWELLAFIGKRGSEIQDPYPHHYHHGMDSPGLHDAEWLVLLGGCFRDMITTFHRPALLIIHSNATSYYTMMRVVRRGVLFL